VTYTRHNRTDGRWVPQNVLITRPLGDERVGITLRALRVEETIPDDLFEFRIPEGAEVVELGKAP